MQKTFGVQYYVVLKMQNSFFPDYRIHKQEIEVDFQKEMSKVQVSKQNAAKQPDLEEQMGDFLQVGCFI